MGSTIGLKHPVTIWREAQGLSQQDAAKRLGVDQSMLSRVEAWKAHLRPRTALRMSRLMGIALDSLLDFGDTESDDLVRNESSV